MEQKKLEEAKDLLDTLIGMVDDNHHSDYDGALKVAIECIDKVQSLETLAKALSEECDRLAKENASLLEQLKCASDEAEEYMAKYDGAMNLVTMREEENTDLSHRVESLDLLLDWAIECNFDFDSLGDAYDEFKGEVFDMDGYKESMIKIAECYIEKYGDERWH